MMMISWQSG